MDEKTVVSVWNYQSERTFFFICYNDKQLEKFLARLDHPSARDKWGEPTINPLNEVKLWNTGKEECS